jgi:hypothetical protein
MAQLATKKINNAKAWTSDEDERLRNLIISNVPAFDIAADLGRTVSAVRARAQALRISLGSSRLRIREGEVAALARSFWMPEEDNRLRMLLGAGKPIEFVAAELKRSEKAVTARAYLLRISLKHVKLKPKAKGK